jgi:RNA polymerase sigma-70 factor (ECF subfamily)
MTQHDSQGAVVPTERTESTGDGPLIAAILNGDEQAFTELMQRYEGRIYAFGFRMCGRHEDALDLTQETFLTAFQSLGTLRNESALTSWLYRIATNICLMQKKKRSREVVADLELDAYLPTCDTRGWPNIVDWSDAPEQALLNEEAQQQIQKALLEIPAKYRAVFILRDIDGLSTAEAADILGIRENTVKVQLHRARVQLRAIIERYFKERGNGK